MVFITKSNKIDEQEITSLYRLEGPALDDCISKIPISLVEPKRFLTARKIRKVYKLFEAKPGGAPCNVLAMLQKLGHQTAFIGKVGQEIGRASCRERV